MIISMDNKRKMMMGGDVDFISGLPDEILESILSRLTMKEAGRTSVISRRWKNLWEFRTGSMDFDFGKKIMTMIYWYSNYSILKTERVRYTNRVNNIISRHRGNTIEEFRVEFDLLDHAQIDSWINFALKKRVQKLELQLEPVRPQGNIERFYRLPPLGTGGFDISCLRSLGLHFVSVTGKEFAYILTNCKLLEYFGITLSMTLVKSRVLTPCPKLKHLELQGCIVLQELYIHSAPNLTTFSCSNEARFRFRNVPKLSHVSIRGFYYETIVDRFHDLPITLSRLQKLTLKADNDIVPEFSSFPELKNMKELELIWHVRVVDISLLSYAKLIKACPNLNRLRLKFLWWTHQCHTKRKAVLSSCTKEAVNNNLKELEVFRFRCDATDSELVTCILSTSPNIDKIKVIPENDNVALKVFLTCLAQALSPDAKLLFV